LTGPTKASGARPARVRRASLLASSPAQQFHVPGFFASGFSTCAIHSSSARLDATFTDVLNRSASVGLVPVLVEVEPGLGPEHVGVELVLQREACRAGVLGVLLGSEVAWVAQRGEGDEESGSTRPATYSSSGARLDDARVGVGL